MFDECIFSYYIGKEETFFDELTKKYSFSDLIIYADSRTPYESFSKGNRECVVFGYAVNVLDGNRESLPEKILKNAKDIDAVVKYEESLGGKYLILYSDETGKYILGDATTSIPIYYCKGEVTSNPEYFCRKFGLVLDDKLQKIRESGDISQAMPFDVTPYNEIKQLIPNHYYSFGEHRSVRFVNSKKKQSRISVSEATQKALPMIGYICDMYLSLFDIYCPITSGRDSRVVLAFLLSLSKHKIKAYTIKHNNHTGKEQDLTIPFELANVCPIDYKQIVDLDVAQELRKNADLLFGQGKYSTRTLEIAHTVKKQCGNSAIVNGDIIGQVGKCSLHRDIPAFLASPRYFRCKLHNYSHEAKEFLVEWLAEIKKSGEKVNTFDLFSVESRMGRWAGKENLIYNSIGQVYLNIFNSRSIIYTWSAVSRKERKKSLLHIALIKEKYPALLDVPFGKSNSRVARISKSNGLFYYFSSYAKYYVDSKKFHKGVKQ